MLDGSKKRNYIKNFKSDWYLRDRTDLEWKTAVGMALME